MTADVSRVQSNANGLVLEPFDVVIGSERVGRCSSVRGRDEEGFIGAAIAREEGKVMGGRNPWAEEVWAAADTDNCGGEAGLRERDSEGDPGRRKGDVLNPEMDLAG